MKRIAAFILMVSASPAYAVLGVGDLSFDPTTYGAVVEQYQETVKLYQTARGTLDQLVDIERTIKDAQRAYETLASGDLRGIAKGMKLDTSNVKSAADLRAELANTEGGVERTGGYMQYQLSLIGQLENLSALQKAAATNLEQSSTGKQDQATSAALTSQSTAALAALAAAEEQRRVKEEIERAKAAKAGRAAEKNSIKVYAAIGSGSGKKK